MGQGRGRCEQAVKLDAQNSDDHMWLGRALGEKASRASFLSAYRWLSGTRAEFEEAVRLNPRNAEALADLGEFYHDAPSVVGGGLDKAETVAAQLGKFDPARAHELRGRIAEARKDYGTAEREVQAGDWRFGASGLPVDDAGQLLPQARALDGDGVGCAQRRNRRASRTKSAGVALYNGAASCGPANRDPALAAKMLEEYLAGTRLDRRGAGLCGAYLAGALEGAAGRPGGSQPGTRSGAGPGARLQAGSGIETLNGNEST